jgi:hypothetical protein
MSTKTDYHSYLLRVWRDNADLPWRASLQSTVTREKQTFADPLMLITFLIEQLTLDEETDEFARFVAWLKVQKAAD